MNDDIDFLETDQLVAWPSHERYSRFRKILTENSHECLRLLHAAIHTSPHIAAIFRIARKVAEVIHAIHSIARPCAML